jgi:hypothetical protein
MLQIIEILLYLQIISGTGTVPTAAQIDAYVNDNKQAIQQVQNDNSLLQQVDHDFHDQAQGIVHIDYDEGIR